MYSIADHPLTKLLGEYQYSIYMMLQPVGSAVEKAGGLPRLEIQLDNCGMDRKPSEGNPYNTSCVFMSCTFTLFTHDTVIHIYVCCSLLVLLFLFISRLCL